MASIAMLGANALESMVSNSSQTRFQKFKQEFQQLGQDLQSGNASKAQSDLASLDPSAASGSSSSVRPGLVSQGFSQLAQDLQSGNLTAAQSDYATLQQDLQQRAGLAHHRPASTASFTSGFAQLQQTLGQLGQSLQAGNLSGAQQAYTALQAESASFSPFGGASSNSGSSSSTGTGVNITV